MGPRWRICPSLSYPRRSRLCRGLATQVSVQIATSDLVGIDIQVHAFVTDLKLAGDLFRAPLDAPIKVHLCLYLGIDL